MASTSSTHLIPISFSQSWNYDVFLSFRGKDTRNKFVAHLYSSLVQQGIHTYKDDKTLPQGSVIGPSLLQAIRESRIAIIILSENYADSSWCLDELSHIMECADEMGQIVMPVFYDVDPSDVRKQKGKYREAFVKFELEKNHKVESWRKALTNVGKLSGWVPKNIANGDEEECVKVIVGTIISTLSPLISKVSKDLIGIKTRLQDLKSKLEIGRGGVRIVGLWGVGGSGKTTLASSIYTEILHQFEYRCFLENVREESSKHSLKELQKRILSCIWKTEVPLIESVQGGRALIERSLSNKNVLIVLDDVDNDDQLEALAGSRDWFGEGSRLIITTRDKHVLTRNADVICSVSLLSHTEAAELFHKHAYREDKPIEDYHTLSCDVITYCDRLPLALKILGCFLYDKDKDQWISALARLRDVPNPKVMDKLRISYDGLEPKEKELFLDIACLFRQEEVDFAMPILHAFGFHPVIGLTVLAQKSLITVLNGRFDMHDLIQEMAHYIIRGEHPDHPEGHTRVWRPEDVAKLCATGTTKENHTTEALSLHLYDEYPPLLQAAASMKNLRCLFWQTSSSGWLTPSNNSTLPKEFQPTKLVCLILKNGSQEQLWEGCKNLPNLKILDLSDSEQLLSTPDFRGLPHLERLILKDCRGLKEIHPSIGCLERLVLLDMEGCERIEWFPPIIQMTKLETLNLSGCKKLGMFPEIQMNMGSLVELRLDGTDINCVPTSIGQYCTNLAYFDISNCKNMKRIEGNFFEFHETFEFHKTNSTMFKNLMNCFGKKSSHQDSLSMSLPQSPHLFRNLNLSECHLGNKDIPSSVFDQLINLQVLCIHRNTFSRLPNLSRLQLLKKLKLSACWELVELPDLPSNIAVVIARNCASLKQVGDLSIYKCLCTVSLEGCHKLVGLESAVRSMLQGSMVRDSFLSVTLPDVVNFQCVESKYTLQLPQNWYNKFNGFLLCIGRWNYKRFSIIIKQEPTCTVDSQPDEWEEFDKNLNKGNEYGKVGYVPFALLRHTSWWNSAYTNLSFYLKSGIYDSGHLKVGLVPKIKDDLTENPKAATDCSGFWDEEVEGKKTFSILNNSESSIEIQWCHC